MFVLDSAESDTDRIFSASLTFLDGPDIIRIGGVYAFLIWSGTTAVSSYYNQNAVQVSALLGGDTGSGLGFYFFPYVIVPFTNQNP